MDHGDVKIIYSLIKAANRTKSRPRMRWKYKYCKRRDNWFGECKYIHIYIYYKYKCNGISIGNWKEQRRKQ